MNAPLQAVASPPLSVPTQELTAPAGECLIVQLVPAGILFPERQESDGEPGKTGKAAFLFAEVKTEKPIRKMGDGHFIQLRTQCIIRFPPPLMAPERCRCRTRSSGSQRDSCGRSNHFFKETPVQPLILARRCQQRHSHDKKPVTKSGASPGS